MGQLLNGPGQAPTHVAPAAGRVHVDDPHAAHNGGGGGGGSAIARALRTLEDVEIHDQHSLKEFCDAVREVNHRVAYQVHLAALQVDAGARAMARDQATLNIVGPGIRSRIKAVTRALEGSSGHSAQGAADAVRATVAMERLLDELHNKPKTAVRKPRGFTISMD